jgi:hypothetical protein
MRNFDFDLGANKTLVHAICIHCGERLIARPTPTKNLRHFRKSVDVKIADSIAS